MEATQPRNDIWIRIMPFPFALAKVMHKASASIILALKKVAVQGIHMVPLAPNYIHNTLLAAIAVQSGASLALSAVAAFAVVAAAVVAFPVHQQLQSDLIGFILLTSCQVELVALTASQQEMMWKM